MSTAFSVYFSVSLKKKKGSKSSNLLTSLLASGHYKAFVMCSFHVAEIIHLALLCLADTSINVCYIIKPVVSLDWTLRQNSLVAKWKILLRGADLSSWLCPKYVLVHVQLLSLPGWRFFVLCVVLLMSTKVLETFLRSNKSHGKQKRGSLDACQTCFCLKWLSKTLSV